MKTIFSFVLAAAFAVPAFAQEGETAAPAPVVLPAISVALVVSAPISDRIFASGLVGPVEEIVVQPQIEGQQIEALLADIGERVEQDQVLAQLSKTSLLLRQTQLEASAASANAALAQGQAQLVETRASAEEAVRVRDRTSSLRDNGAVSQAALDQATSAATSALARVTAAEQGVQAAEAQIALAVAQTADVTLSLARTSVKAPVAGEITTRNASVGAIATAGGPSMFVIIRDGLLELRADVAERDVLRLAVGQKVSLRVVGRAEPLTGMVRLVEPTVDIVTRLGRVRIALDDPGLVRSGMFAEAEILAAAREGLTVPVAAVQLGASGATVLRVDADGLLTRVPVTTGIRDRGTIEILTGLAANDTIVSRAGAFVREGERINPVADTAADMSN
jgi:HlyD family secretion protein